MTDALTRITTRHTPQTARARADQVQNNAGGYGFAVDDWTRALRFLILGTQGGTYYVGEQKLTRENADVILRLAETDGVKLVELIVDVSEHARAPRQDQAIFALAICAGSTDVETRRAASAAITRVCRTGTTLFLFARYVEQFRGWGPVLRRGVAAWYDRQDPVQLTVEERRFRAADDLAYQAVKYRQREGWTHKDMLRLTHPVITAPDLRAVASWITGNTDGSPEYVMKNGHVIPPRPNRYPNGTTPRVIEGFERAQAATTPREWASLVDEFRLPWEALPDAAMNHAEVWEALLPHTPLGALVRQLGRLSNIGVVAPLGGKTNDIIARLTNFDEVRKARLHPLTVLSAMATYASGHGFRGTGNWTVVPKIVGALNECFHLAFGAVVPAGKRTLVAVDVSGSMSMESSRIANSPLHAREAAAAMAMVAVRTEPECYPMAFSGGFVNLPLTASQRLDDVIRMTSNMPFERTDCAVPMVWAQRNKVHVDTFVLLTDNESWAGPIHPFQALRNYRDTMVSDARFIAVGMAATRFTVSDPTDAGSLDVVGFDTAAPNLISAFSRGDF